MKINIYQGAYLGFVNKLLKWFLKLLLVFLLLVGILFLTSKFIEQKIVEKAVAVINSELEVPIYVENISFSLLKKFPYASLQLKNVTILSAKKFNRNDFTESYPDTLIFLQELYLSVNLRSLMDNRLDVTKAYAQKGQINLLVDNNGNENYKIVSQKVKVQASNKTKKELFFMLNHIQLKEVEFRFINKYKNTALNIYAPLYNLKGQFYKKEYTASSSGNLLLNYFEQGKIKLSPVKPAKIIMNLGVSNNAIEIIESSIETADFQFVTNGTITWEDALFLNLKITGSSNNLDGILAIVGDKSKKQYATEGRLGVSAIIRGVLDTKNSPTVAVNFQVTNGLYSDKELGLKIDKIAIQGSYTNGDKRTLSSSRVDIDKFNMGLNSSSISGKFYLQNFNKPLIELFANTSIKISDLDPFIKNKANYLVDGNIQGEMVCKGYFDAENKNTLAQIKNWQKSAQLHFTDVIVKIGSPKLDMQNFSGDLSIVNNQVSINKVIGTVQTSNIKANASIDDYYVLLVDSLAPFNIKGSISADQLDYKNYKHFFETDESSSESRSINVNCDFRSESILYDNLVADKASGYLSYVNERLQITDIVFNTMEGKISGNLNYFPQGPDKYIFQTQATTKNINIKTLFSTYNNFDQKYIIDENIDGYLTSNFDLEMYFINYKFVPNSIELLGHARIDNGILKNFAPIKEMSKYSDIEELNNIKFSTLENDIMISKGIVNIPKMDLNSNAFDISLYGNQQFNGDYEYHMRLNLSDFLGGKSKRIEKQNSEFGYIEDDGYGRRTLFLIATSKNNISKVKLDNEQIKNSFKHELTDEQKEFKEALNKQFGWFKNDTTLNKTNKTEKKPAFVIEWDEE